MAQKEQNNILIRYLTILQEYTLMVIGMAKNFFDSRRYWRDTLNEMYLIGAQSFPIVFLSGLFMGIILSLEVGHRFALFGAKNLVGRTVSLGMIRELGPVISGLLLSARTGAKNASEIGSMRITDQIDALEAFGISPISKLVLPRVYASLLLFMPLTAIADLTGLLGGMFVADMWMNIDAGFFWRSAVFGLQYKDLFVGFFKPVLFGFFISTISCYYGLYTKGGTRGLGRTTINAVVSSSIVILIVDFIFTKVVWEVL